MKIVWALLLFVNSLFASGAVEISGQRELNIPAIIMFLIFVLATLGITYWAARRTKTAKDFFNMNPPQNN